MPTTKLVNYKQSILHKRKVYAPGEPFPVDNDRVEAMLEGNVNIMRYEDGQEAPEPEPAPEPPIPAEEMTKAEISDELIRRGVAFDGRNKKATLVLLLEEARRIRG